MISKYLDKFLEISWVANAFRGVKIAVGILIVDAAVKMLIKMKKKPMPMIMVVCSAVAMILISIFSVNISSMVLMLVSAFIGIVVFIIGSHAKAGEKRG